MAGEVTHSANVPGAGRAALHRERLARLFLAVQMLLLVWTALLWVRLRARLARAEAGQSLVEYSVLTAIVVFGGMIIYVKFGEAIGKLFERMIAKIGGLAN